MQTPLHLILLVQRVALIYRHRHQKQQHMSISLIAQQVGSILFLNHFEAVKSHALIELLFIILQ